MDLGARDDVLCRPVRSVLGRARKMGRLVCRARLAVLLATTVFMPAWQDSCDSPLATVCCPPLMSLCRRAAAAEADENNNLLAARVPDRAAARRGHDPRRPGDGQLGRWAGVFFSSGPINCRRSKERTGSLASPSNSAIGAMPPICFTAPCSGCCFRPSLATRPDEDMAPRPRYDCSRLLAVRIA